MGSSSRERKPSWSEGQLDGISFDNRRLLAWVPHSESPDHFTLAVLVNTKWSPDADQSSKPDWHLFHMDSLPRSKPRAAGEHSGRFAAFLLRIPDDQITVTEVPVPPQPGGSECGLCAVHFLRIFLEDIGKATKFCLEVSKIANLLYCYLLFAKSGFTKPQKSLPCSQ